MTSSANGKRGTVSTPSPGESNRYAVIVGAQKAGTTALHALLERHPGISASEPKELHYFDIAEVPSYDGYASLYVPAPGGTLMVEATPSYLRLPYVVEVLARVLPDARLLAVLREPVARAHSAWWMHVGRGDEKRSFEQAVADEFEEGIIGSLVEDDCALRKAHRRHMRSIGSGQLEPPAMYVWGGRYAEHLRHYWRNFDPAQLLVLFYEELIAHPDVAAVQLGEYLDLDPTPLLGGLPSANRAIGRRSAAIQRARAHPVGKAARAMAPPPLRRAVKNAVARGDSKPPPDPETADLLAEYYREPNAALAELLGRELPW